MWIILIGTRYTHTFSYLHTDQCKFKQGRNSFEMNHRCHITRPRQWEHETQHMCTHILTHTGIPSPSPHPCIAFQNKNSTQAQWYKHTHKYIHKRGLSPNINNDFMGERQENRWKAFKSLRKINSRAVI